LEEQLYHRKGASELDTNKRRPVARLAPEFLRLARRWRKSDAARGCDRVVTRFEVDPVAKAIVRTTKPFKDASAAGEPFRALRMYAGLPGISIHTLRHTCATWLLEYAPIEEVARFLGVTVDELEKTYGQYDPAFTAPAARALNEWGREGRPEPTGKGHFPKPASKSA
jgi:integrase